MDDICGEQNLLFKFSDLSNYLENHLTYKNHIDEIKSWFPKTKKTNYKDLVVHIRRGDNGDNIIWSAVEWERIVETT